MDGLRNEIAAILAEHGRVPPADAQRLIAAARREGHDETWFWAEVEDLAASDPQLAAKRRLVIALRNRAQLMGSDFDVSSAVEKSRAQARSAGWSDDELRAVAEQIRRETTAVPETEPDRQSRGRAVWIGAGAVALLLAAGFALLQSGGLRDASQVPTGEPAVEAPDQLRSLLDDLDFVAGFDGTLGTETRRLLVRLERDPDAGGQTLAMLRRALRDSEAAVWSEIAESGSMETLERFVEVFPDGRFAVQAGARIDELREGRARAVLIERLQQQMERLGQDVDVSGELDAETLAVLQDYVSATGGETPEISQALVDELASLEDWPRRPGEVFRDCPACPEMVVVPAGRFLMGGPEGETGSEANERPVHEVRVPRFALGRSEVTFDQWAACVDDGGCDFMPPDSGWGRGDRPVINVSWGDALAYLRWLTRTTGHRYRLPTEAEWEYAARAGTTTRFHTGRCISSQQANFDGRRPAVGCPVSDARRQTLAVGSFPPNAFGVFDMAGNVREWTRDCWNDTYEGAPEDGSAWMSGDCSRPVLRGGSWRNSERAVRSANRTRPSGTFNDSETGFRPARDLE